MKLQVERKDLDKAVTLAMLASGRSCKDAALQNVLIKHRSGQASVESFDTHVYSRAVFPATGDPDLEFAIEGTRLQHLVSSADEGNVVFDSTPDGVEVVFGRANIKMRTFPVDKYVRLAIKDKKLVAEQVRSGLLLKALDFVRPFVGKDTQQPSRMLAELRGGRMLAGDGVRIAVVKFGINEDAIPQTAEGEEAVPLKPVNFDFGLKVPQAVISNVSRWLKEQVDGEGEALITISETEDFYFFETPGGSLFGWRKPEHDFLAVEEYLERFESTPGSSVFKVDKESLERAVDSVSVVLEAGAEKVTFGLNGSPMMPMLSATAYDARQVPSQNQVQIVLNGDKPSGEFSLRYSHLLDTLKLLDSPVVTCNVRKEDSILQVKEVQPELTMTALLTLMTEA
jgi:DNA polymerase III sliding clamp (beta) subunit (PCNA family)